MTLQFSKQTGDHVQGTIKSLTRIVVGLLFASHGASTLFGILVPSHYHTVVGAWPGWYAAVIELVGGLLVAAGLFTRTSAIVSSGSMAFAYFTVHQLHGLLPIQNGGEPAVMFCWAFLLVAAVGAGPFALDTLVQRRRQATTASVTTSRPVMNRIPQPVGA